MRERNLTELLGTSKNRRSDNGLVRNRACLTRVPQGDLLRFAVKEKRHVWLPKRKPVPVIGTATENRAFIGKVLPSQRLLNLCEEQLVFGEMNLSEIVSSGAQMRLRYALERQLDGYVGSKLL